MAKPYTDPVPRFWAKVDKNGPVVTRTYDWPVNAPDPPGTPCWLWTGADNGNGYGVFSSGNGDPTRYTHRYAYTLEVGPIPEGYTLDHLCKVWLCCRPSHLEPVTQAENNRRRDNTKMGEHNRRKTHCPQGHPLDGVRMNTGKGRIPTPRRYCMTCNRLASERRARARGVLPRGPKKFCRKGHPYINPYYQSTNRKNPYQVCRECVRLQNLKNTAKRRAARGDAKRKDAA